MTEQEIREVFRYHKPSPTKVKMHEEIREIITEATCKVAAMLPASREREQFIDCMQYGQMMANAAIAIHVPFEEVGEEKAIWDEWWKSLTPDERAQALNTAKIVPGEAKGTE